jgi:hypothetical protein
MDKKIMVLEHAELRGTADLEERLSKAQKYDTDYEFVQVVQVNPSFYRSVWRRKG